MVWGATGGCQVVLVGGMANAETILVRSKTFFVARRSYVSCRLCYRVTAYLQQLYVCMCLAAHMYKRPHA